jgi:hypothetical protein
MKRGLPTRENKIMVRYPVRVPRDGYKGRDPKKRQKRSEKNRIAKELEDYLNRAIEKNDQNLQQYLYGYIAADTGFSEKIVRDILFGVDAGHNGLTVIKNPSHSNIDY